MNPDFASWGVVLAGHLEQSTVFAVVAWLLTIALRRNRAAVRYWIWFVASIKFLLPTGILVALGSMAAQRLHWQMNTMVGTSHLPSGVRQIALPVLQTSAVQPASPVAAIQASVLPAIFAVWALGSLFLLLRWGSKWRKTREALRAAVPHTRVGEIPILSTRVLLEPGVYGLFKPVLLIPAAILEHLPEDQLSAIIAHEICHVRRRDNLLYLIHLLVETLFWFHPLLWWIGARLLEEREGACDEATVLAGNDAEVYAQGILNICKFCLRSVPAWASGVSGADLKSRLTRIVREEIGRGLSPGKIGLLTGVGLLALVIPFGIGVVHGAQVGTSSGPEQSAAGGLRFAAAVIKPGQPSPKGSGFFIEGRRLDVIDTKLEHVIAFAYGLQRDQIVGAPDWMDKEQFDITAVAEGEAPPTVAQWKEMVQNLLADRFALLFHHDQKVLPVLLLTVSKGGPKLKPSAADPGAPPMVFFPGKWGTLVGRNARIGDFVNQIQSSVLDRPVIDETGLTGRYDFTLKWTPDESQFSRVDERIPPPTDPDAAPPLFTAMQEQLGLKFESTKAPADVIVIDRMEKPSSN